MHREGCDTKTQVWIKCSGHRGSDQLVDRRAKGLVSSNINEDSIWCFCLEHDLGTQTSCKRSSGVQEEDFTEQKRTTAGSPCQQQHPGETAWKADAGNPERSISKRCSSYTASSLRNGYLATSLCSGEVLLRDVSNPEDRKRLSNTFGTKSPNKDLGWNQTTMLSKLVSLPFQSHAKYYLRSFIPLYHLPDLLTREKPFHSNSLPGAQQGSRNVFCSWLLAGALSSRNITTHKK